MSDLSNARTITDADFEQLVADIEQHASDSNGKLRDFAKGAVSGIGELLRLSKAVQPEDEEEDEDEDDEGDEGDDPAPGIPDTMNKGTTLDLDLPEVATGSYDGTELLQDIQVNLGAILDNQQRLGARLSRLEKAVKPSGALRGEIKALRGDVRTLASGTVSIVGPMSKAIADIDARMLDIPEPVVGPLAPWKQRLARVEPAGDRAGGAKQVNLSQQELAKALSKRVISPQQLSYFKRHGNFGEDEDFNAEMVAKVTAA